jgi:hypothetical protein
VIVSADAVSLSSNNCPCARLRGLAARTHEPDAALLAGRQIERQVARMHEARRRAPRAWKRLRRRARQAW